MIDEVPENDWTPLAHGTLGKADFRNAIADFYLTNPIARASQLMAELSAGMQGARTEGTGGGVMTAARDHIRRSPGIGRGPSCRVR